MFVVREGLFDVVLRRSDGREVSRRCFYPEGPHTYVRTHVTYVHTYHHYGVGSQKTILIIYGFGHLVR